MMRKKGVAKYSREFDWHGISYLAAGGGHASFKDKRHRERLDTRGLANAYSSMLSRMSEAPIREAYAARR